MVYQAFSDTESGWAIYNGELRHASNSTGTKYGCLLKNDDTVGVLFDTIEVMTSNLGDYKLQRKPI